jgi:hypothetical protein
LVLTGCTGWVAPEPTALGVPGRAEGTLARLDGLVVAAGEAGLETGPDGTFEVAAVGDPAAVDLAVDGAEGGADVAVGAVAPVAPQAVPTAVMMIERARARAARFGCCRKMLKGILIRWNHCWSECARGWWTARDR